VKAKRKTHANGKAPAKSNPHVSGRASKVYRLLMGKDTRAKAITMIRGALKIAKGRVDIAATDLSVSSRTLSRWLSIAGLRRFAASQRASNNIPGPR
jgi:hypothetical protein